MNLDNVRTRQERKASECQMCTHYNCIRSPTDSYCHYYREGDPDGFMIRQSLFPTEKLHKTIQSQFKFSQFKQTSYGTTQLDRKMIQFNHYIPLQEHIPEYRNIKINTHSRWNTAGRRAQSHQLIPFPFKLNATDVNRVGMMALFTVLSII